jgi:hypothetical protein
VKPTPSAGPRCAGAEFYQDAAAAIAWLCAAFGVTVRIKVEHKNGAITGVLSARLCADSRVHRTVRVAPWWITQRLRAPPLG